MDLDWTDFFWTTFQNGCMFWIGYYCHHRWSKPSTPAVPKKRLVKLGAMTVKEVDALCIPTTDLFLAKGTSYYVETRDSVPDSVWMTWPKNRNVTVWWNTDQALPGR